jgi:hypothetical protein
MNLFFLLLSCIYVAVIFLMADSSVVSTVSKFNAYSLLHVPLYAILAGLLVFATVPFQFLQFRSNNRILPSGNGQDPADPGGISRRGLKTRFIIVAAIGIAIAMTDEIHQSFIPSRQASFYDVLLDITGIMAALFLIERFFLRSVGIFSPAISEPVAQSAPLPSTSSDLEP